MAASSPRRTTTATVVQACLLEIVPTHLVSYFSTVVRGGATSVGTDTAAGMEGTTVV